MECNKDEATRAKEIAEKKFTAKDILGAKKFALKAQSLFPALEGIRQMVATLDVYISADNKINGDPDWYGMLGVNPRANDETVRKHYRKLALMLHPDKNKSIGADGAFKLISEAWSLLSDKAKRVSYDQKTNAKQKVSSTPGGSSAQPKAGSYNFTKTTASSMRAQKNTSKSAHSSTFTHNSKSNTFWTVCHRCKTQYEYLRVWLNLKLVCPNCHEAFMAVETAPPPSSDLRAATSWNFSKKQKISSHQLPSKSKSNVGKNNTAAPNVRTGCYTETESHNHPSFEWGAFARTSSVSTVAQAANVVQQTYEKVKREREEARAATKREEALRKKQRASKKTGGFSSSVYSNLAKRRRGMEDTSVSGYGKELGNQMGTGIGVVREAGACGFRQGSFESGRRNGIVKTTSTSDLSQVELQSLLMEKARKEICKKLTEFESNPVASNTVKVEESGGGYLKATETGEKSLRNSETLDQNKIEKSDYIKNGSDAIKSFAGAAAAHMDAQTLETMLIDVPDPDFYDFDKDRTERSFEKNQVWAAYDDNDGMPRYYAIIHGIGSLDPFKMRISWLNSKTNGELGPLNWVASGFTKTCGDFRIGRCEIIKSSNSFSHRIRWIKGTHGAIHIYPRKGDVWALYRNWSPDWSELTADEVMHKYDMVEVLEDYTEEHGVIVIPLVKVAGFKTVFHRHLDPRQILAIAREEMFRFSHQVPSYLLTGEEARNAPKGCRELDPAAIPSEFLQVIEVVKEEDMVNNLDKIIEETAKDCMQNSNGEEMTNGMVKRREEKECEDTVESEELSED
ncbi:hypothetical protein L6164_008249 [Bauhinia variegata]|uniref:Uncharacterized protein n=2 Tax=Bauhinia variegata TaxID=167791 RepID=A0ACB9PG75_BAUVA|nr:hypothetical protein L6164_008249 [Bauhinia variegata]